MKQLIIVSDHHNISEIIKNVLIFESYDPIVLSSLEEAVKAFNRGRFEAILFVDYQNSDDGSLAEIITSIIEKTKKTVIMEYIYSSASGVAKIADQHDNIHLIHGETKPNTPYNPEKILSILQRVFKSGEAPRNEDNNGSDVLKYRDVELSVVQSTLKVNGKEKYITPAQANLLSYFMTNQGAVISKTSLILEYLNKNDLYTWSEYLDDNVAKLQELIGDNPKKPQVIKIIEGIGYYITPA